MNVTTIFYDGLFTVRTNCNLMTSIAGNYFWKRKRIMSIGNIQLQSFISNTITSIETIESRTLFYLGNKQHQTSRLALLSLMKWKYAISNLYKRCTFSSNEVTTDGNNKENIRIQFKDKLPTANRKNNYGSIIRIYRTPNIITVNDTSDITYAILIKLCAYKLASKLVIINWCIIDLCTDVTIFGETEFLSIKKKL